METILVSLEKYSNVLIVIFTALTTTATILIWWVARKQTEISSKQTEYMCLMGEVAEQPIIEINYTIGDLRDYTMSMENNFETVYEGSKQILTIQISNIGRGAAHNLKIEQRGRGNKRNRYIASRSKARILYTD